VQNGTRYVLVLLMGCAALFAVTVATAGNTTYTYDALGRLNEVIYPNALGIIYTYDAAGNRTQVHVVDTSPPTAPGAPTYTSVTQTSATVHWTAATDNVAVASYEYQVNSGSWVNVGNVLSANLAGLTANTNYTIYVHAKDAGGYPGAASSSILTTLPGAPGTPTFSSIAPTTATMSWTAPSGTVTLSYSYSLNNGSTWTSVGTVRTASLTGLTPGTNYTALVRASNVGGTGPNSSPGNFTTLITDSATMTEGGVHQSSPGFLETWKGYKSPTFGSLSPSALSGGKVVSVLYDFCQAITSTKPPPPSCPYSLATDSQDGILSISGFTADPGATWLTSVTAAGATRYGASAIYSYASGTSTWSWIGPVGTGSFGLSNSGTTNVVITHKP
jgi:hypothetical protein